MRLHLLIFCGFFTLVFLHRHERLHSRTWLNGVEPPVSLYLHRDQTEEDLADSLHRIGWIRNPEQWRWVAFTHGWKRYKRGHYLLEPGVPIEQLIRDLTLGIQSPVAVTVPAGADPERLAASLERQLAPDSTHFSEAFSRGGDAREDRVRSASRLLPDTYSMYWTSDADVVISRLGTRLDRELRDMLAQPGANPAGLTEAQIVTMASIVEWEARYDDEKPVIAGLYLNRLRIGMPLQADPTVAFAIGERRRLFNRDYRVEHPYNTYRSRGLPPGPITNPSLASIRSVVFPDSHDYLYMVATQEGRHTFNETYDGHLQAVAQWQQWIREQYRLRRQQETGQQAISGATE